MDIEITQTETCACGRTVISVAGTCALCIREGAEALQAFTEGKITFPGFMRRLRKKRKKEK